jgi:hypothetical protein
VAKSKKPKKPKGFKQGDHTFASEGTKNPPQTKVDRHSDQHSNKEFQQHDPKNRLGNYAGDGNHPRATHPGHQ